MDKELYKVEELLENYSPLKDEEYMCARQLKYFKSKLESMLVELKKQGVANEDSENNKLAELREERKKDIEDALQRIEMGIYGYCDRTGDEIGIRRLKANPLAKYCIEEQERIERENHMYSD